MDEAERFLWRLSIGAAIILIIVLGISLPAYTHERPAADCTKAFIYPICERATIPEPLAPAPTWLVFLSIIGTAALAIILAYVSYHACVTEQANIVTPTANAVKQNTPGANAAPAQPAPSAQTVTTPAAPTAKPSSGVNVKSLS